ncbi:MAG TPA: CoA-binding protein [Anaerolineaceae bacterium]
MNQAIQDFIQGKRFALVGASRTGKKFGNSIATELKARGYDVLLVHPEAQEIDGERCYPTLAAVKDAVDGVIVCVRPQEAVAQLREAARLGMTKIWIQQGAQSAEAETLARELGVTPVMGKCLLMYMQPVKSFHGFHRAFAGIFGQL